MIYGGLPLLSSSSPSLRRANSSAIRLFLLPSTSFSKSSLRMEPLASVQEVGHALHWGSNIWFADGDSTLECIQLLGRLAHGEQTGALRRHAPRQTSRPSSGHRQGRLVTTPDARMGRGRGRAEEKPRPEIVGIGDGF